MIKVRILHVDDEPDIREVVELSLGLDPAFETRSCGSGREALVVAAEWKPDFILLDFMMPVMDGPATLVKLQNDPETAAIPVIFMTARAQVREADHLRSLGAAGVIAKPFDPMTLSASVRSYVQLSPDPLSTLRAGFLIRVKKDAASLSEERLALRSGSRTKVVLGRIKQISHSLCGAGGIYGFAEISDAAASLEDAVDAELAGHGSSAETDLALDSLLHSAIRNHAGAHKTSPVSAGTDGSTHLYSEKR